METTPAPTTSAFDAALERVRSGADPRDLARDLYAELTETERLDLLDGDVPFWPGMAEIVFEGYNTRPLPMGVVERLGIPGLLFADGPRGMVVGHSTAFPVSMARGATWDVALEERIGEVIGAEGRVQGANFFGGVCINLPRHPAWGRVQETYGEDPVLLGELGAALARGAGRHLMSCVKHYALNSMENARFSVDVQVDEGTLHEFYLPHFRRVIEAGASAVMSAYNSVNGEWAGQNSHLLTKVLREDWGFDGVVITDFIWGMRDGSAALRAGLDVEAPFRQQRGAHLADDLSAGRASWDDVERAGLRIVATQLRFYAGRSTVEPTEPVAGPAHRALAREAAQRSMVLLRNEPADGSPLLPLHAPDLRRVAVLGRLADLANTGDRGSSDVRTPSVVTPLAGLRAALPDADVVHLGDADPQAAAAAAARSDVAVVVVGYTAADEGEFVGGDVFGRPELTALYPEPRTDTERELQRRLTQSAGEGLSMTGTEDAGGDRADLHLRREDVELIRAVAAANARTVVAVVAAGTVLMEEWQDQVPAIVLAWYSGMEGGAALADVLLGSVDASGRLPFCIPSSADHLPDFDRDATSVTYDRWFGQRRLEHLGVAPAYPLGYGLSYTTVTVEALDAVREGRDGIAVRAVVRNTGQRDGRHVVQVYGRAADGERFLLGFAPVAVAAGQAAEVTVPASLRPLGRWDSERREVRVPEGPYRLEVGSFWGDPEAGTIEA